MKIIFSRKGSDSKAGGIPSPILGDELISLPIPGDKDDFLVGKVNYQTNSKIIGLETLLCDLKYKFPLNKTVHLDPWIDNRILIDSEVKSRNVNAFGPFYSLNTNRNIVSNDLFLFFGWFRQTLFDTKQTKYIFDGEDKHLLWGYLQVEKILATREEKDQYLNTNPDIHLHPHFLDKSPMIVPTSKLSFSTNLPGQGVFNFSEIRVLTKQNINQRRSFWDIDKHSVLKSVGKYLKQNDGIEYFYKRGQWQDLILELPEEDIISYLKTIFI